MSIASMFARTPASPGLAATVYVGLLMALGAATALPIKSVLDQRAELAALTDTLRLLDAHSMAFAREHGSNATVVTGSAFLEGSSVTVAGAALVQRVNEVVSRHGGSVSSSQLDVQSPPAKARQISVSANFEADQAALQPILYDLEAGMPCLFVDELVAEGGGSAAAASGKLRIMMTVSGQWQGPR
ncbi:type II secretion system protein GspM [Bradyrhizobium sp. SRS-191]|uniref:type II secretion system protein GspM n=1 Tax=Bradyrhizobium sp. SRS-191 TaxID=2962606 RepID=UPI00211F162F|nr:type II secretion system protein GspM [Bradyrhizobium sp. SRS-191]